MNKQEVKFKIKRAKTVEERAKLYLEYFKAQPYYEHEAIVEYPVDGTLGI